MCISDTNSHAVEPDGWGPWTSSKGSTWSEQTGRKPFEYSAERSRGFTAPRFVRDAERLEYEKKYSPTELRVRRVAIAAVFFGGIYTLWSWAYGAGLRRRRLASISRQAHGELAKTPMRDISTTAMSSPRVLGPVVVSAGVPATGMASLLMTESSRRQAASHKAIGDAMKANGDFAGAAKAYRDAALSAGVDKMFVEGRVGRLSEGGTEFHARMQRSQSSVAAETPVLSESAQSQRQQERTHADGAGIDDKSWQHTDTQRVVRGRARSGGLAGYKDSSERTYTTSHTKGTTGGRLGTVTANGLATHVRIRIVLKLHVLGYHHCSRHRLQRLRHLAIARRFTATCARVLHIQVGATVVNQRSKASLADENEKTITATCAAHAVKIADSGEHLSTSSSNEGSTTGATKSSSEKHSGSGSASNSGRRQAAKAIGRATTKGGGIRRESHRVNLIPTNHWDLYGTGANASHRYVEPQCRNCSEERGEPRMVNCSTAIDVCALTGPEHMEPKQQWSRRSYELGQPRCVRLLSKPIRAHVDNCWRLSSGFVNVR